MKIRTPPRDPIGAQNAYFSHLFDVVFPLLFGALKSEVKEQKMVSKSSKIPPKRAQNGDVLEILGFHEN